MNNKAFLHRSPFCLLEVHLNFAQISSPFEEVSLFDLVPTISSQLRTVTLFGCPILHETNHGRLRRLCASQGKGGLDGLTKTVGRMVPLKDKQVTRERRKKPKGRRGEEEDCGRGRRRGLSYWEEDPQPQVPQSRRGIRKVRNDSRHRRSRRRI
ncbi:hypothetical protein EUTSA_v10019275mg [Eutrema salsugineum]|uniref:Uncharacterized protein n=1 Tax=Eutrema salsugineum TaxID=72664 RepID=V4K7T7_EUTSA|nr:hypothetical protein EUTSA_v10019275mg [Eutrema salsugineum]